MKLFLQKNAKFLSAGGYAPRPPNPPLRISSYAPAMDSKKMEILQIPLSAKTFSCPSSMEKIWQENFINCAKCG